MLIDIHVHTGRDSGVTRNGVDRYPTPEELLRMMDDRGIDLAAVMCVVSPECRYRIVPPEEVLRICAGHPDRLVPFTSLDPRMVANSADADFGPLLRHYKEAGCRGVGEYMPNLPFDDPMNLNLFAQIEDAGLPVTFHIGHAIGGCYGCYDDLGLPRLERVLREFPRLVFLGHSQPFWAEIGSDVTEESRRGYPCGSVEPGRAVDLMRAHPNLYGDLSAHSGYNAISRDPLYGALFLEEFQDRLLFGTDLAHTEQDTPVVEHFNRLRDEGTISHDAWEKITWRNATRLLRL